MYKDDIKLPPLPYPYNTPAYRTVGAVIQDYARSAIKSDRQSREQSYEKGLKLGNLITLNLDGYPALGRFFIQIWEGDSVVARVYGESQEEARSRANDLLARYVQTDVPEGWQLVPKNPTKEMRLAGKHTIKGADTTFEGILAECAYLSMLEAAPKFGKEG